MTEYKPKFEPDKFKEIMLYAAQKSTSDEFFGAVKLNKILFFSDFLSYGLSGDPITGATYIKREKGPVPRELKWMDGELERAHDAAFLSKKVFNYTQKRLTAYREANLNLFSAEEIDLVDEVIKNLSSRTATETSDLSHDRSFAWEIADIGEVIPYSAVFLSRRAATSFDIERGLELGRKHGWV